MELLWHEKQLVGLMQRRGRLPHALLVHGREGVGQFDLAGSIAQSVLCERPLPNGLACGRCLACVWFEQGNHPDFRLVQPDSLAADEEVDGSTESKKKSEQIRIDQVRDLQRFLSVGTHRAGMRVILVHPADTMNSATQNALLKSLEEPPPATLFLIVTSQPHRLLPTVRSRCQAIAVPAPEPALAVDWLALQGVKDADALLALAGGAPLSALRFAESESARRRLVAQLGDAALDPIAASEACLAVPPDEAVDWLQRWVYDLASLALAGQARYYRADEGKLRALAARCSAAGALSLLRKLAQARALSQHPLNAKLFFEDLLIAYQGLVAGDAAPIAS